MSRPEPGATTFAWIEYASELEAEVERLRTDFHELNGMVAMLNRQIINLKVELSRAGGPEPSRL
jgi:hypothetical protein